MMIRCIPRLLPPYEDIPESSILTLSSIVEFVSVLVCSAAIFKDPVEVGVPVLKFIDVQLCCHAVFFLLSLPSYDSHVSLLRLSVVSLIVSSYA